MREERHGQDEPGSHGRGSNHRGDYAQGRFRGYRNFTDPRFEANPARSLRHPGSATRYPGSRGKRLLDPGSHDVRPG
ncbi:hypothetical protein CCC_00103 [Paramagnetospirillum magnetotacticum MS-1]|uniref:Uncharacterized protein n=1 Tax=Paramagnetospirillum magnetotacticum MS-1 TaxID=272627 RepID=A0A0C2U6F7_PARME|nr:hypothetical protein CCC_00103 [Paramagnetospirillum magnetotacticum MS-1]